MELKTLNILVYLIISLEEIFQIKYLKILNLSYLRLNNNKLEKVNYDSLCKSGYDWDNSIYFDYLIMILKRNYLPVSLIKYFMKFILPLKIKNKNVDGLVKIN